MAKIIPIGPNAEHRDPAEALDELRKTIPLLNWSLESWATEFSGITAIGAIGGGEVLSVFILAPSSAGVHVSPAAAHKVKVLAQVIGSLPTDLRATFEDELALIPRAQPVKLREAKYLLVR